MQKSTEISKFYGLHESHTITLYFHRAAPIGLNMDQVERSQRPVFNWMKMVKEKIKHVTIVQGENDLEAFENSQFLMFMIVDEENKKTAEMFASLSFNYPELTFSYMIRNDSNKELEKKINSDYQLEDVTQGSKYFILKTIILFNRSYFKFQF